MTRKIYALLVGIDAYVQPLQPLKGCINDIKAFQDYLERRVITDQFQLLLCTLLNQEATRQAVIDRFRQHLSQARCEDVALFYFAGHGSQQATPDVFWHLEPDHLNETLVCYDSRFEESWDLADKELATLIADVSEHNPHVVVILDCCHSGSGTRGDLEAAIRHAPIDQRQRPLESFLGFSAEKEQTSTVRNPESASHHWISPKGKHILLAACRDLEEAKEYNANGQRRGIFSYFLTDTLEKANGSLTYRDLFKRTCALVCSKVTTQSPQLEAIATAELDQPFLGGAIAPRNPYFMISFHREYGWVMDGGAVHGICRPLAGETTELVLFPFDRITEQLRQLTLGVGKAQVLEVMPQLSKVQISGVTDLHPDHVFKAVVTSLPLPPLTIALAGESEGIELARQAIATTGPEGRPSLYIQEVARAETAELRILAQNHQYWIMRPIDDRPLVKPIDGFSPASAAQVIQQLEHIARWIAIADLSSPATSQIKPDAIQLQILQNGQELQEPDIQLTYQCEGEKQKQPSFQIKLKNTSDQALYCAVLTLTDRYAVSSGLFETGGIWLSPGEEAWAASGGLIYVSVPRDLWQQGITEVKDIFKLIVSTAEFDGRLLEQDALELPQTRTSQRSPAASLRGILNRLMHRVQTRHVSLIPDDEEFYDDWMTSQFSLTTVRPQLTVPVPHGSEGVLLGSGVELHPHSRLHAHARLTTMPQSTRHLGHPMLPPVLLQDDEGIQPFQFTASRGNDPGLSVLELSQVVDASVVTSAEPLTLTVDLNLDAGQHLLAIAYDGEFFLPLGQGQSRTDGKTEIRLNRLPSPLIVPETANETRRSLGSAIWICFQKIVSQRLALERETK
jgi:hypothetical protein